MPRLSLRRVRLPSAGPRETGSEVLSRDVSAMLADLVSEDTLAVKLHRCAHVWLKLGPCWRVQKALDEQAINYELVKGPNRPSKRDDLERLSGQRLYPVIEFENGRVYRAESKDMAAQIRAGQLLDEARAPARLRLPE